MITRDRTDTEENRSGNLELIKVGGVKPRANIMGKKRVREVKIKSKSSQVKVNPFEVRINKRKYSVLGQRREKGERGLPGISRSRALEKANILIDNTLIEYSCYCIQRKKTLLRDYQERDKTNQLLDRRFGTDDVPEEERELQRFLLETKVRTTTLINMFVHVNSGHHVLFSFRGDTNVVVYLILKRMRRKG